jgi:hypothetical protein
MGSLRLRPPLDMLHFAPNWPDIQHCPVGFFGTPRPRPSHGNDVRGFPAALREPCECRPATYIRNGP